MSDRPHRRRKVVPVLLTGFGLALLWNASRANDPPRVSGKVLASKSTPLGDLPDLDASPGEADPPESGG